MATSGARRVVRCVVHESSFARQMLSTVLASVGHGHGRVRAVHGWVSPEGALSAECMAIHFRELAHGTAAEGAQFTVRILGPRARCVACGTTYEPVHSMGRCPKCHGNVIQMEERLPLGVDRIELETP